MNCQEGKCVFRPGGPQQAIVAIWHVAGGGISAACEGCAQQKLIGGPGLYQAAPLSDWADSLMDANQKIAAARRPRLTATAETPAPPPASLPAGQATSPAIALRAAVTGEIVTSAPRHAAGHSAPRHGSRNEKRAVPWLSVAGTSIVTGVFLALVGDPGNPYSNSALIGLGVALIVLPILAGIIAVIVMVAQDTMRAHREWISKFPPGQQASIRQAEKAALWGAMAVGAVALHEHHKRTDARLTESVLHGSPQSQRTRANHRAWQEQRDRNARAAQPAPPGDGTARLLGHSAAIRQAQATWRDNFPGA